MTILGEVKSIALGAGDLIMRVYGSDDRGIEMKGDRSPLTEADRAADNFITGALKRLDPAIPCISEESPIPPYEARRLWTKFWLVDPLDGTKEFLKRNGEFTVNIALIADGVPELGVIYAPALGTMYFAERGKGAWKQDGREGEPKRIFSRFPDPGEPLVVAESRSHPSPALEDFLKGFRIKDRIKAGSSLKFGLLAEGKADIYPRLGPTMEWDVAAGDCVYRYSSAGAPHPTDFRYNKPALRNGPFVAGLAPGASDFRAGSG